MTTGLTLSVDIEPPRAQVELDASALAGIVGALVAAVHVDAPLQRPDFGLLSVRARGALAALLRQMADALDAPEGGAMGATNKLEHLRQLEDDWDQEGAPKPSAAALERAARAVAWAEREKVHLLDVSADVLGGVAIWFDRGGDRQVWLSCMNDGCDTIVCSAGSEVVSHAKIDLARDTADLASVLEFLQERPGAEETG